MPTDSLTWLITSTTYGTWLPGDARGFVGRVWETRPSDQATDALRTEHDVVDTPYDQGIPGLEAASRERMKGEPILLNEVQADVVIAQFQETATFRGWKLHTASVMANHFHLVVSAPADVMSDKILGDFKSYASRSLNQKWSKPRAARGGRRRVRVVAYQMKTRSLEPFSMF
jgi:REP element-mobilizing transposase RayT